MKLIIDLVSWKIHEISYKTKKKKQTLQPTNYLHKLNWNCLLFEIYTRQNLF